jgi:uncharacterized membrane protein YozB (DUF420 family)
MSVRDLPTLNATLNALSAIWLLAGYVYIKRGAREAHRNCMIAAVITSAVFLVSYLTYHSLVKGVTRFQGPSGWRAVYLLILTTHSILAAAIVPMVIINVRYATKQRWESHKRLARWLWPLWMYVSVTGVVVYAMLYHLFPSR